MVFHSHLSMQRIIVNQGSLNIRRGGSKGFFTKHHCIPNSYEKSRLSTQFLIMLSMVQKNRGARCQGVGDQLKMRLCHSASFERYDVTITTLDSETNTT